MLLKSFMNLGAHMFVSHRIVGNSFLRLSPRLMAYDSTNSTHKKIHDLINKSDKKIYLFMKGTPDEPMCRYSAVVVSIFQAYGLDFDSYNVLEDSDIRRELKSYADWPTIPQVYKEGTFIGGCDILIQMHENDEIKDLDPNPKKQV